MMSYYPFLVWRVQATRQGKSLVFGKKRGPNKVFASLSPECAWECAQWNCEYIRERNPGAIVFHEIVCIAATDYLMTDEIPPEMKSGNSPRTDEDEVFVWEGEIVARWDLSNPLERTVFEALILGHDEEFRSWWVKERRKKKQSEWRCCKGSIRKKLFEDV